MPPGQNGTIRPHKHRNQIKIRGFSSNKTSCFAGNLEWKQQQKMHQLKQQSQEKQQQKNLHDDNPKDKWPARRCVCFIDLFLGKWNFWNRYRCFGFCTTAIDRAPVGFNLRDFSRLCLVYLAWICVRREMGPQLGNVWNPLGAIDLVVEFDTHGTWDSFLFILDR